jgi:hypothetical protein
LLLSGASTAAIALQNFHQPVMTLICLAEAEAAEAEQEAAV